MTLLAFAETCDPAEPGGPEFLALLEQLQGALVGSCLLPITARPPQVTRPSQNVDWVTVPAGARRATTLGLLRTYARWYQPSVSLFHGADARALALACYENFGTRLLWEGGEARTLDGKVWTLPSDLLSVFAVSLIVDEHFDRQSAERVLRARALAPELRLYCKGHLGPATLDNLRWAADQHAGKAHVFIRLKQGLLTSRTAVTDMLHLLKAHGRFEVTVRGEKEFGSAMSHLLSTTLRAAGELR